MTANWLTIRRGMSPLVLGMPHTGSSLPGDIGTRLVSPWRATMDADWWIDRLYAFGAELDATIVATSVSRTVIDCNRDPSGVSLYPGQTTTTLCPTETFDGAPLYVDGGAPDTAEIAVRRDLWFTPYHAALTDEIARLRRLHANVVLYDCHSIRSHIARLFDGELPQFNIGDNSGVTCAPGLTARVAGICAASGHSHVVNGRFRGGYTTRHYGDPANGVHAVQMELAMRGYLDEPDTPSPENWPPAFDAGRAAPLTPHLHAILTACLEWAAKDAA
jgi:N-formylglutamate deformylase